MKRIAALVLLLLLTGGPAFAAAPSPPQGGRGGKPGRHASRDRQPAQRLPVDVLLGTFTPTYLKSPTQTLHLSGLLRNRSSSPFQQLSVRLRYGDRPVISRGALDAYAAGDGFDPPRAGPSTALAAGLRAGGQQAWRLTLPAKQMRLPRWGVYPVAVEVLNAGAVVGHERTFITYYPKGTLARKTSVSWIWPLIDQPHRTVDTTFLDDHLERRLGSGRLAHILNAAARTPTPISWLVDPALVDDAVAMTGKDGYTIKDTATRPQNVAATKWLETLRGATAQKRLIATPYADPDVAALTHAGMAKDIKAAAATGLARLNAARLVGPSTSVAVPPDGTADPQTLASLVAADARTVLLSSTVLPDMHAQITPDPLTQRTVGGTKVKLIAYDETLHRVLDANTNAPGGRLVAERRFLAETAMITAEAPFTPRTVVVVPPRRWNPDPTFARHLLTYSRNAPWLRSVALKDVEALRPGGRVLAPVKNTSGLSRRHLRQVKALNRRIQQFTSIMRPPVSAFTLGVARAESSAWSDQTRYGAALRTALDSELTGAAGKIRVLNEQITLLGKSAQVPITISNGLDTTVEVKLHAYSQNNTRLRVTSDDRVLLLEPGHQETITLFMKAAANGPGYINLELLAPDERTFSDTRVLRVNTTAYGRTALLITGVSLAVLFLGVAIRVIRRKREGAEETSA